MGNTMFFKESNKEQENCCYYAVHGASTDISGLRYCDLATISQKELVARIMNDSNLEYNLYSSGERKKAEEVLNTEDTIIEKWLPKGTKQYNLNVLIQINCTKEEVLKQRKDKVVPLPIDSSIQAKIKIPGVNSSKVETIVNNEIQASNQSLRL